MNAKLLLDAMEGIQDSYIVSAQERLGYLAPRRKSKVRPLKRAFTVALAAALVLLCTVAAAMAVSPRLREAIISLFQISEAERVPGIPAGVNEVKQVTIGGQVSAQYVKVEGDWFSDGALLTQNEEDQSTRFYDLKDGQLVEVGADAPVTSVQILWHGEEVETRFRWFVYDGMLYLAQVYDGLLCRDDGAMPRPSEGGNTFALGVSRLGTRTDVALLSGEVYGAIEDSWYWVYDLETGEVRDILSGCGIEELGYIRPVLFAEDLKHALVRAGNSVMGRPYLVDLETKTCTPLGELMGLDIDEDTRGSYDVSFYDSDTVLLAMSPLWRPEPTSVWTYHIPSGTVTPTVSEETGLKDIGFDAYRWALAQKVEDGSVTVLDLHTGDRVKLEGISVQDSFYLKANASGNKLLWADWKDNRLNRLGVVDLETGVFTAFQRDAMEMRFNEGAFWLGDDRVATMMDLRTGADYVTGEEGYYLCIYEF